MDQQDKIAHLNELAHEHFNEGNLSAAINAWQQVLEIDAANTDAQRGVTLAQQKMGAASGQDDNPLGGGPFDEPVAAEPAGGPFDADETMMFSPGADPAAPVGGAFDADATMMFSPGSEPPAAAPVEAADADATMMFNPGDVAPQAEPLAPAPDDAGETMMFNPADAAAAAAPPPAAAEDDGGATMMFTPGAVPEAAPPAEEPADADATMMFSPGDMPMAAPPADAGSHSIDFGLPAEPAAPTADSFAPEAESADQTMLTPDDAPSFDLGGAAPPPPAPEPEVPAEQTMLSPDEGNDFEPPPPPAPLPPEPAEPAAGGGDLEDFEMPSGGLEMAGPPDGGMGGLSLPDAPPALGGGSGDTGGGGGFSFDLPPAPTGTGEGPALGAPPPPPGGDFSVPDLPSLGPPPPDAGAPPPLAPPPPPDIPDVGAPQPSGQFGEVDPGEIEGLAVPTVGATGEEEAELSPEERAAAEEAKAAEFAAMYGKEGDAPAVQAEGPLSSAPAPSTIPWKLLIPLGLVIAIVCGVVGAFLYFTKEETAEVIEVPRAEKLPEVIKTPAEWKRDYENEVADLKKALQENNLDDAVSHAAKAREYAAKAGLEETTALDELSDTLQFEQGWTAKYELALRSFCIEDYETAMPMFDELAGAKPSDARPSEYIGRIYYNLAVQSLQSLEPGQAVWAFQQAIRRLPGDAQAKELLAFAESYPANASLGGNYAYTSTVDPLQFRKAGCN